MKTPHRIFPFAVSLFCIFALVAPAAHAAKGGKGGDTISKVVEVNKQALANLKAGKFDAARDALWNAIVTLNDAGLAEHEISARTRVHLAAVYMTGFRDRNKAIRQFVMALKINPNIKITPHIETPELVEAMDAARVQIGLAAAGKKDAVDGAAPAPAPAVEPAAEVAAPTSRKARKTVDDEEPSPPSKVKEPLFCPLALEVPPQEDIMVRCVTQKKSRQASATLFYREAGSDNFTPLPMVRSPKGWLSATVPGSAVTGNAFQFYISAKVPGTKDTLSLGSADSPTLLPIVNGAQPMNNALLASILRHEGTTVSAATIDEKDDSAPLKDITEQYKIEEDLRKYHRRYVGSIFFSLGGGTGITYHRSMKAAGRFNDASGNQLDSLQVGTGTNLASLGQLVPEIGYVVSEKLAISLQGRIQYLPFDSSGLGPGSVQPPTMAWAVFARGQYNFFTVANFQTFLSAAVGGGPHVFMGNIPKSCDSSQMSETELQLKGCKKGIIDHNNVVLSGPVAGAVGIGFLYHLTRNLGLWLEARGMASVAPVMFLGEVNAGLSVAIKFEKSAPPPPKEGEGGWEKPPEEDKPLFETPPSD